MGALVVWCNSTGAIDESRRVVACACSARTMWLLQCSELLPSGASSMFARGSLPTKRSLKSRAVCALRHQRSRLAFVLPRK